MKNTIIDIFRGTINTFVTIKYRGISIARCIPNDWDINKYLRVLSKEIKNVYNSSSKTA